jgi:hypothetical protein
MDWWESLFVVRLLDYLSKTGTNRLNEWIANIEKRDARRANWGAHFDQAHAQVKIEVKFMEGGLEARWGGEPANHMARPQGEKQVTVIRA